MQRLLHLIFLLIAGCTFTALIARPPKNQAKLKRLPAIEVYDLKNHHTTLGQIAKGKVTIIDCWFIPCPPCFREMELMHELNAKYKGSKDVQVLSLCRSDTMVVKRFLNNDPHLATFTGWFHQYSKQKRFALPLYFIPGCNERIFIGDDKYPPKGPDDKTKCPDQLFKFRGYPTVIIADKKGSLVWQKTGYQTEWKAGYQAEIEKAIHRALFD